MSDDTERLRKDLIDMCGTAAFNGFPAAITEISRIKNASKQELVEIARSKGMSVNVVDEDD